MKQERDISEGEERGGGEETLLEESSLAEEGLERLQERLGYRFGDRARLERALTHPSYANERRTRRKHNQRMEFLGDAVLGMLIASYLYEQEEFEDEGVLTHHLSSIVREESLANAARKLGLGEALLLGRGEDGQGGRERDSILCDAYEALVAAIFLDGGYARVREVVLGLHEEDFERVQLPRKPKEPNYKGQLQKKVQAMHNVQPHYEIVDAHGPEHDKMFVAVATMKGEVLGRGEGRSKKHAEQSAARDACERLAAAEKSEREKS